jgi:hypothetical protein
MSAYTYVIRTAVAILFSLCFYCGAVAQTTPPAWLNVRSVGTNDGGKVKIDAAGNFYRIGTFSVIAIVGGVTLTTSALRNAYVAKFTSDGTLIWVRQIGGPTSTVNVAELAIDAAGHVYVVGYLSGNDFNLGNDIIVKGGSSRSSQLVFVARFSPQGNPEWAQQTTTTTLASGITIAVDEAGNVYFSGCFNEKVTISDMSIVALPRVDTIFLARLSAANGAVQALTSILYHDKYVNGITQMNLVVGANGKLYLVGDLYHPITFNSSITIAPQRYPTPGGADGLIACLSTHGSLEWVRQIVCGEGAHVSKIVIDAGGNIYLAGSVRGGASFGDIKIQDLGVYSGSAFLAKYSSTGIIKWVRVSEGSGDASWESVSLDATGAPYVIGVMRGSVSIGSATFTNGRNFDTAVVAYSSEGQLRWVQATSNGYERGDALGSAVGIVGNEVYVAGQFSYKSLFGTQVLWTAGSLSTEAFIGHLGTDVLATQAARSTTISIYPNPATDQVQLLGLPSGSQVNLVDALGRLARTTVLTAEEKVSVVGLNPGLYSLQATDQQGQTYRSKLVIH